MSIICDLPNLASALLGSKIIFATDEWFAEAENLIKDEEPVWQQNLYTDFGKWMDGWESRRRRTAGHDWCIIQLGVPGLIERIEIDTAFFTGNFSLKVSLHGAYLDPNASPIFRLNELRQLSIAQRPNIGRMGLNASQEEYELVEKLNSNEWQMIVPLSPLGPGYETTRKTLFQLGSVSRQTPINHIRLNMGPDGGIARLKAFGEIVNQIENIGWDHDIDLGSILNGGRAIACSNMHYGHPQNMLAPGRGTCMGDGWETARQPNRPPVYTISADGLLVLPGCDWAVLKLGVAGSINQIEIDTHFYKGNYPESCKIEGCYLPPGQDVDMQFWSLGIESSSTTTNATSNLVAISQTWKTLLPRIRLEANKQHFFHLGTSELLSIGTITHLRVTIYPDGGIMRIRALGRKSTSSKL